MQGIQVFDSEPYHGPSDYRAVSCENGFDAPKVLPVNDTTIDWWYFDAVADDGISSLVVVFFLRGSNAGFPGPSYEGVPWVQVTGTYPNGTTFLLNFVGNEAIVSTSGQGASGIWGGEHHNISFTGTPDLSEYQIELKTDAISGVFHVRSTAPPHYPCSQVLPGRTMEIVPGIGWANSIPDGDVTVDVEVNGTPLTFTGIGYHDKNWAVNGFNESLGSWYWGHARAGPYSLVWIDALTQENEAHVSGYAVRDGQILSTRCDSNVQVRPVGQNITHPPFPGSPTPDTYHLEMTLNDGTILSADLLPAVQSGGIGMYARWVGNITATVGDEVHEGLVSYEYFNFFGVDRLNFDIPNLEMTRQE
ncbi:uncharacterized protein B0I36DRAFT_245904 [Microdochium trichocladiopsis]|uniref:Hydroxyneurosporene synthase n=1 Tax=Microdochium trichocladiopsis TaxID=1682393 RepID=A0A9P8Y3G7_9PEZI|nr:uncharacterized protein B0I36DRAFT_245904 [Microdochium trichocladiopsis]KAH7029834.1 hypothetical protein B0I36DRAFT_245904 [Microdochium trichocladiopsis]